MPVIACSTGIYTRRTLAEALQGIADLGFTHVDLFAFEDWAHVPPSGIFKDPEGMGERVREELDGRGLACIALNSEPRHVSTTRSEQRHRQNLKDMDALCVFTRTLGAGLLSTGAGPVDEALGQAGTIAHAAARFRDLVKVAQAQGVQLTLETHSGQFVVDPDAALALVAQAPGLKIAYDPSHFIKEGIPIANSLKLLAHTAHVHLRNARAGCYQESMDKGLLDMPWMIDQVLQSGYRGIITVEYIEDNAVRDGYDVVRQVRDLTAVLLEKDCRMSP